MIGTLGEDYVNRLRRGYAGWLPGGSALVCYWFAIADRMIRAGRATRIGFVSTNSIRGGANRKVLDAIRDHHTITDAWADEEWTIEGAAVRVSLVCFGHEKNIGNDPRLDGQQVSEIFADLTGGGLDLTKARRLNENRRMAFQGPVKVGPFDVRGDAAREWLILPSNPNGRTNADVVRPLVNGMDITRRPSDTWIIDFADLSEPEACLYEAPFEHVQKVVKPFRDNNRDKQRRENWWRLGRSGADLRQEVRILRRYIATPRIAKHRILVWLDSTVLPDSGLVAITRHDDTTFGILHSRFHEAWALRLGTSLEDRPRYTPSTTFETFPFPDGLTPDIPAADYAADPRAQAIARTAARLDEMRRNWLNPPDLVNVVPEVVPGFPDRLIPKDDKAAAELKKRTLTNLYNARPAWLAKAHADLDAAVAAAYGWPADITEDDALARLLDLNHRRADVMAADRSAVAGCLSPP